MHFKLKEGTNYLLSVEQKACFGTWQDALLQKCRLPARLAVDTWRWSAASAAGLARCLGRHGTGSRATIFTASGHGTARGMWVVSGPLHDRWRSAMVPRAAAEEVAPVSLHHKLEHLRVQ